MTAMCIVKCHKEQFHVYFHFGVFYFPILFYHFNHFEQYANKRQPYLSSAFLDHTDRPLVL